MQAVTYTEYGSPDVLKLTQVPKPVPRENEVLIKVRAAGVNAADWHLMRGTPFLARLAFGLLKPKVSILGADVAGEVAAVGSAVTKFKKGDKVFGDISGCGFGAFAEYVCARENAVVLKPTNLTFAEAAVLPLSAVTALQALRKGQLQSGQKVLINGASGGVGAYAVQIAKALGAKVTAVCSTSNLKRARAMGADHVIDYTKEDFTQNGQQYDLILAANGYHPLAAYKRALKPNGVYVMSGGTNAQLFEAMLQGPWLSMRGTQNFTNVMASPNLDDLNFITELIAAGKLKPRIHKTYPLGQTADAIRYVEEGHAQGKVVIAVDGAERK